MASLREIRRKIKSVKSTQQITKAMKMVAAARMRRAQNAILSSRPFAVKLEQTVRDIALLESEQSISGAVESSGPRHAFFKTNPDGAAGLVLVTADKGLCGAFNTNVLRAATAWIGRRRDQEIHVALAGRKGRDFIHRLRDVNPKFMVELVGIFPKVSFAHAELIGKPLLTSFAQGNLSSVAVIYNEFKSAVQQRVVEMQLLPIARPQAPAQTAPTNRPAFDFKFEPAQDQLLSALLPRYIKAQLYRILLESQAAELAARMNAMDSASKNASELIDGLTLWLNRTRQAMITREIAELVGGAEALAS